jgi:hypothetical protein
MTQQPFPDFGPVNACEVFGHLSTSETQSNRWSSTDAAATAKDRGRRTNDSALIAASNGV